MEFLPDSNPKFEVKPAKMPSEIFAILCQPTKGPSVQALEIIRHVDASFDRKKSRWDYFKGGVHAGGQAWKYQKASSWGIKKMGLGN